MRAECRVSGDPVSDYARGSFHFRPQKVRCDGAPAFPRLCLVEEILNATRALSASRECGRVFGSEFCWLAPDSRQHP